MLCYVGTMASNWFYAMAGGSVLGLIILFLLKPVDFNVILIKRLKEQGVNVKYQVEDNRTNSTECSSSDNDGISKKNIPERNTFQKEHSILQKTQQQQQQQQQQHYEENQSISNDSVIDEIPAQSAITGL